MAYILFSAVGTTDPICNYRDGAILHICRNYKPEKIYLFFSQEIYGLHKKDNRYFYSIEQLSANQKNFNPKLYEIVEENLSEVHKFDAFYELFEKSIMQIHKENPEHIILLNLSSGTPAMKNALNLIAALNDETFQAIQVSSPMKSSNPKKDDIKKYDPVAEWECNEDNDIRVVSNRTSLEKNINLIARIKKEIIIKHIQVYDYQAAVTIAKDIEAHISNAFVKLLKAACYRMQLDEAGIDSVLSGMDIEIVPMQNGNERNLMEFLLWLQVKQIRRDYADFIRGITPAVADLFELILKKQTGIELSDFCVRKPIGKDNYIYIVERGNLVKTEQGQKYLEAFESSNRMKGKLKDGPYSSVHALILTQKFCQQNNPLLIKTMEDIRDVETKVRNLSAHEIVSITDEWIIEKCGFSSSEIMKKLRLLVGFADITVSSDIWKSYDRMNDMMIALIMEGK